MWQDKLLYFPQQATLAAYLAEAAASGLAPWPDANDLRGLVREPVVPVRATVVLFHGNAGHAAHRAAYADFLAPLGYRIILAEYPGYGPRPGTPGEPALVADAIATLQLARHRHPGRLILGGESLGAGVAAAAAAAADALLLITPWDTLAAVARHHYPWLPVGLLLRDRYDSVAHLRGFAKPLLIVAAERDTIVPPRHARALHDALSAPRMLVTVPSAGHNDWLAHTGSAWWQRAMKPLDGAAGVAAR